VLEPAAISLSAEIERLEGLLREHGALYAHMSGSGSAVFGIFANKAAAIAAQKQLDGQCPFCEYAHSVGHAIKVVE
jgi:4-diphosphocytidyl-2-C-methyl-D-erythritol kinase